MNFLISGGGTGGHIFPALSIAGALRKRFPDCRILYVGALGRMEMERVPAAGYDIVGLPVAGFDRRRLWRNFGVLIKLWKSMRLARRTLRDFRPDVVIGVGGYASGPVLKEAQRMGIPTVIQEQNSYAGVTNKLLGAKARVICTAYEGMERFFPADRIILTGNPVRADLLRCRLTQQEAKAQLGFPANRPLVLVVGGSLGARTINRSIAAGLQRLADAGISVMWQTGKLYADEFIPLAADYPRIQASAFISDMATAYRAADLVVSRAGAGTISELQLLGKAAVLVPSPNVAEDHQRKNAEALTRCGAAVMVADADADSQLVDTILSLAADHHRLADLAQAALEMALPDADEKIVDKIQEIANERNR
ncbi:MAG: undecaprenyldiphospho-muramoylpentapeptide beta-N-acetylglucosaminyltransferase [Muribaculaceae bacterium]|nr:undecaprenyldiphospho-muramoylpentapeptide beta-N-acetylglucosaminyltransferase [Muribaculaceae bacterium]